MSRVVLPTDFKDDIMNDSMGGKRRYVLIDNGDGTVSLEDATTYDQLGDNFGAAQINETNNAVNESVDKANVIDSLADISSNVTSGKVAGALAVRELNSNITTLSNKVNPYDSFRIIYEENQIINGVLYTLFGFEVRYGARSFKLCMSLGNAYGTFIYNGWVERWFRISEY